MPEFKCDKMGVRGVEGDEERGRGVQVNMGAMRKKRLGHVSGISYSLKRWGSR